jgi:DNA polymerase (family 10)
MPVHNADVAAVFNEIADMLELEEGNPFRVRAYRNAARVVGDLSRDLADMVSAGEDLMELRGIGADLASEVNRQCIRSSRGVPKERNRAVAS